MLDFMITSHVKVKSWQKWILDKADDEMGDSFFPETF